MRLFVVWNCSRSKSRMKRLIRRYDGLEVVQYYYVPMTSSIGMTYMYKRNKKDTIELISNDGTGRVPKNCSVLLTVLLAIEVVVVLAS